MGLLSFIMSLADNLLTFIAVAIVTYVASFYSGPVANFVYKCELFMLGAFQMVFSKDRKWAKPQDPDIAFRDKDGEVRTKTIIFVRHGESDWNEVFNRGFGPSFIVRLVKALAREGMYLITRDSLFFDSPLSELGMRQAKELQDFLAKPFDEKLDDEGKAIINGQRDTEKEKSLLVAANLRRAIATATLVLQDRLQRTSEKLLILSALQEISRNVDTIALALPHTVPDMHGLEKHLWAGFDAETVYDTQYNYGTKSVMKSNGMARMKAFCDFCFERKEQTIIVGGGHSLYFREFFRTFLPFTFNHDAKNKKMVNCGAVRFTLSQMTTTVNATPTTAYRIDPNTLKVIYGGFTTK
eukprot:comp12615_c0_seq1/m.7652 comp12615_c0_seq1/g.7652  ORF comp12615_c0_seq1/g.7652 comp12615_c0_seq1/m.7652 type:complete len:354 (-) comp12615_c0_seq1:394-1455(-)